MATVQSPVSDFTGFAAGVEFRDGEAETDDPGALSYFQRKGYTIDGQEPEEPAAPEQVPVQPEVRIGSPLADAAEQSNPDGFLPPVDTGEGQVSPQVHDEEVPKAGIVGGDVADDLDRQEADEQAAAAAATGGETERPPGNGSREAWHDYALSQGRAPDELEDLSRDEIRELFPES